MELEGLNGKCLQKDVRSMKTSIVIPAYRPTSLLKGCLEGILQCTDLTDVEVIVVCNGSERDSADLVLSLGKKFKLVWYEEAIGFTKAANIGFKLAVGEFVMVMNTGAVILPYAPRNEWLNRMLEPLKNPKVGITGLGFMWTEFGSFVPFYCTAIRRSLFYELGILDEGFSPGYMEDADYCYRARAAGYEITQVDVARPDPDKPNMTITDFPIWHAGEQSFQDKEERKKCIERGHTLLREKWGHK